MKILVICDKQGSAIDRLAQPLTKLDGHEVVVLPVHPKRNDADIIYELSKLMDWADIIDVHYWKSGEIAKQTFPQFWEKKTKVLFHFNPYDIDQRNWTDDYDAVVVGNKTIHDKMPYADYVPYAVDLDLFKFNDKYTDFNTVMMVVNRIEGKKGVKEVAEVCKELDYKFVLVGNVSKPDYMHQVMSVGNVTFHENISNEDLVEKYKEASVVVCNSVDDFESGTLPILEAMAMGVPVLTRNIGHVPEIFNGKNMVVRHGAVEDKIELKQELRDMMTSKVVREKIRQAGWDSVRGRNTDRMIWDIERIYWSAKNNKPLVSIVIPTRDNPEVFAECLIKACKQDYEKKEIVVADSGVNRVDYVVREVKKQLPDVTIKYVPFTSEGYTLAEARNRAVIEARGEWIVFCDERIGMEEDAVSQFMKVKTERTWMWGVKDGNEKGFVENFSCVQRRYLIGGGMFCERMQWYGGMSEDIRSRYAGMQFDYVANAKANQLKGASKKSGRREAIVKAKNLIHKLHHG